MNYKSCLIKITLILCALIQSFTAASQENYKPGYVIKTNGDTIYGQIRYRTWGANPYRISFKLTEESAPEIFTIKDVVKYKVENDIYFKAVVQTEISTQNIDRLTTDNTLELKTDTAFLQTLVEGPKSLYYYQNKFGVDNFYIKQDGHLELLIYKKYLRKELDKTSMGVGDSALVVTENNKYVGQLTIYLLDCPTIQVKLQNISYKYTDLLRLFHSYYNCTDKEYNFQKIIEKPSLQFGVYGGISFSSVKFNSNELKYLSQGNFESSTNVTAGLSLNIILPTERKRWSVWNELQYTDYLLVGNYEEFENENYYEIFDSEIGLSYVKLNTLLHYNYPTASVNMFVHAGISNGYAISEKNYRILETKFYADFNREEGKSVEEIRKYELGAVLGAGITYGMFFLETRIEKSNGMSSVSGLKSPVNRAYFLFGIQF